MSLRTLMRLRFVAVLAQAATIVAVRAIWDARLPLSGLLAILAVTTATNFALPRAAKVVAIETLVGGVVLLDVASLTGLLALTGGPSNPFSVLYLIHVVLAATITTASWTWLVVAVSSVGFGALFFVNVPLPAVLGGHAHYAATNSYSVHLQGMWLAFTVTAATLAAFVSRLSAGLREEREARHRVTYRLGLASLAAGAAHEIGNPLATIRVAASELERQFQTHSAPPGVLEDLQLINAEVLRARRVLDRMAAGGGELAGESLKPVDVSDLIGSARALIGPEGSRIRVNCDGEAGRARWPVEAVTQALMQLFRNALQATPDNGWVCCEVQRRGDCIAIDVEDQGVGMPPEVLARVGEPFFTTREGHGLGLGLFIAHALVEHLGGHLTIRSTQAKGTVVRVLVPHGVGA